MKIKKCVIVIGGMGTRLLPITKSVTKEMLPIIDTPTIFYQVKEAYLSGIKEIIFVVSPKNINLLKHFFKNDTKLKEQVKNNQEKLELLEDIEKITKNMTFHYVLQKEKGTYGALYSARKFFQNETFAVMYGDDLVISDPPILKRMIELSEKTNSMIMSARTLPDNELPHFGIIKYKNDNIIDDIVYKTEKLPSHDVIQGRFILDTKIFEIKKSLKYYNGELQLPKAVLNCYKEIRILLYNEITFDIGSKLGFLKANIYFGLNNKKYRNDLLNYIKDLENL